MKKLVENQEWKYVKKYYLTLEKQILILQSNIRKISRDSRYEQATSALKTMFNCDTECFSNRPPHH